MPTAARVWRVRKTTTPESASVKKSTRCGPRTKLTSKAMAQGDTYHSNATTRKLHNRSLSRGDSVASIDSEEVSSDLHFSGTDSETTMDSSSFSSQSSSTEAILDDEGLEELAAAFADSMWNKSWNKQKSHKPFWNYAPEVLSASEKCSNCANAMVMIEHSGLLKCVTKSCSANGRKIHVVDGDMSCLPFGHDLSYKSMQLAKSDKQLCEADRNDLVGSPGVAVVAVEKSGSSLPMHTSLFNSLLKGCASGSDGTRCVNSSDYRLKVSSDGASVLSSNDAHFKPVSIVFGYSQSNKATKVMIDPYANPALPSIVLYIQSCLCKTTCASLAPDHTLAECAWQKNDTCLNIAEISHIVARIVKETSDANWKKQFKSESLIVGLLSQILGYKPPVPTEQALVLACQRFVIARRFKDEEFAISPPTDASAMQEDVVIADGKTKPFKSGYVWHKVWQMQDPASKTHHFFALPSNKERLASLERWWARMCTNFQWTFYPSSEPLIASKMSVRLCSNDEYQDFLIKTAL